MNLDTSGDTITFSVEDNLCWASVAGSAILATAELGGALLFSTGPVGFGIFLAWPWRAFLLQPLLPPRVI